ncbi:histidine kinase sensor domain-containing protein [Psychrobium sp. 1_MG-2023]|uniref:HAMP domain-containing sensor histidine kinase n=1 Tax=Psychrobium sp. 1_MG-2023 TaxID=3062624 RepID=UPI002732A893|nr:histidine kinase sensor domain-containing protein [Psychrobium sp. 1_MG-2023]MDP2560557.1 histidine kinase sensor domain-containing protein [Psychrobium sp. 1_MG-2023]
MNRLFLWKLMLIVGLGSVSLFFVIDLLSRHTETRMSHITQQHQTEILMFAATAERLHQQQDKAALTQYLTQLQHQEDTWVAVVDSQLTSLYQSSLDPRFLDNFTLGRDVSWKIHLNFPNNPVMDVAFSNSSIHFLIRLPQRMRPGVYWKPAYIALQFILPLIILSVIAFYIYQYLMRPLKQLKHASELLAKGQFDIEIVSKINTREPEFISVATTFEHMSHRLGQQIQNQRQFIADFSHELRTPIARIETALNCAENNISSVQMLHRVRDEITGIRKLSEDALTLAWIENEQVALTVETFDLIDLVDSIIDDAQFEFHPKVITSTLPDSVIIQGSIRPLAQAIENIIRNAMRFTPTSIDITVHRYDNYVELCVRDHGPGVENCELENIFRPFYRIAGDNTSSSGYGLGLALVKREIEALHGTVKAQNRSPTGLQMTVRLPLHT